MYREHPIICPHCNKDIGMTEEGFMYAYIYSDITCPHCGKVAIAANKPEYAENVDKI